MPAPVLAIVGVAQNLEDEGQVRAPAQPQHHALHPVLLLVNLLFCRWRSLYPAPTPTTAGTGTGIRKTKIWKLAITIAVPPFVGLFFVEKPTWLNFCSRGRGCMIMNNDWQTNTGGLLGDLPVLSNHRFLGRSALLI